MRFATDSLGMAVGSGSGGVIQPQSSVFGMVFLTSNDSALLSDAINNNRDLFTKNLKFDAGVGLRAMAFRTVFRLDFAVGDEGAAVQAMISQPFSRPGN